MELSIVPQLVKLPHGHWIYAGILVCGEKKLNRDNLCSHDSVEEALAELISEGFRGYIFSSIVLIFSKAYCTY